MNYREEKSFRKNFENFVSLRLLQNFNRKPIELDKMFSESLTRIYGTASFETLKRIGLAIENSSTKLNPEFVSLFHKSKSEKPSLQFDFILTDEVKILQVDQLNLRPLKSMQFFQNLFHDFYYNYFNNTYKKCRFSLGLGTMEIDVSRGGKKLSLHVFPFDGLILLELGRSKGARVGQLWAALKDSDKAEDQKLFLKCLENLVEIGVLRKREEEIRKNLSGQLTFDCFVKIDRAFFKKFESGTSNFLWIWSLS